MHVVKVAWLPVCPYFLYSITGNLSNSPVNVLSTLKVKQLCKINPEKNVACYKKPVTYHVHDKNVGIIKNTESQCLYNLKESNLCFREVSTEGYYRRWTASYFALSCCLLGSPIGLDISQKRSIAVFLKSKIAIFA